MPLNRAAQTLTTLPVGTRVVVRYRIPGGLTDALGYLRGVVEVADEMEHHGHGAEIHPGRDERAADSPRGHCVVETRTGEVVIALNDVQAAKEVPPPPPRRR